MNKLLRLVVVVCLLVLAFSQTALANVTATDTATYYTLNENWDYTLTHQVQVYNSSSSAAKNIVVTVPLMDEVLTAYNELIGQELSPYPDRIYTGLDGHRYGEYRIASLGGNSTLMLTQRYAVRISSIEYTYDSTTVADTYTAEELAALAPYLQATPSADCDNSAINSFVSAKLMGETNPYLKARRLFSACNLALTYSAASGSGTTDQYASSALTRGTANCEGFTNLYVACLRAAGVPARVVSGYLYQPDKHLSAQYLDTTNNRWLLNSLAHTWVEFYLPSIGWVMADPTFTYSVTINGVEQRFADWSLFGKITNTRRYFSFRVGSTVGTVSVNFTGGNVSKENIKVTASMVPGHYYLPFNDISSHWGKDAIVYCAENNLFNGVTVSQFQPDAPMTRAMFVAVLGRLYQAHGGDLSSYTVSSLHFGDVGKDEYYAAYLAWAVDNGIVQGFSEERFGPHSNVTREQMARMLALFMDTVGQSLTSGPITAFTDNAEIADWAGPYAGSCAKAGLLTGLPDGRFAPKMNASRAQVATTVQRVAGLLEQ